MPKITFEGVVPVSHEALMEQVRLAHARGLPHVREVEPHGRRLAVVGGGPSIVEHLEEIKAFTDIWAINGACRFLRERGIESTLLTLDPIELLAQRIAGAKKAILSSRCHPAVFDALADADVQVFDVIQDGHVGGVWASVSTALVVFHLATIMGFRQTVFFGCEGSYSEATHAYMDEAELQDFKFVVACGGHEYLTAPDLYQQTLQMVEFLKRAINQSFTERSGGLLRAMVQHDEHDIVKVSRKLLAGLTPNNDASATVKEEALAQVAA